jgi:hypothetical protein
MSQKGQNAKYSLRANIFRFTPESRHDASHLACPFRAAKGGHFAARERCPLLPFRSFPRKRTVGSARKGEVMKSVASNADWESASAAAPHCMLS